MRKRRKVVALAGTSAILVAGVLATLAIAHISDAPSHDRKGYYTCKASALRLNLFDTEPFDPFEPVIANPQRDPCADDSESLADLTIPSDQSPISVNAVLLKAATNQQPDDLDENGHSHTPPSKNDRAEARASTGNVTINAVDPSDPSKSYVLSASALSTRVWTVCKCQYPSRRFTTGFNTDSRVTGLTIKAPDGSDILTNRTSGDDQRIAIPNSTNPVLIVDLNDKEYTSSEGERVMTRRALRVQLFDPRDGSRQAELALAESIVDTHGNPCEFDDGSVLSSAAKKQRGAKKQGRHRHRH